MPAIGDGGQHVRMDVQPVVIDACPAQDEPDQYAVVVERAPGDVAADRERTHDLAVHVLAAPGLRR